jgi:hypothetical protein
MIAIPSRLNTIPIRDEAMGLFERPHLPDQIFSALCRGPSRGLHGSGLVESIGSRLSKTQRGSLTTEGVDAA